MEQKTITYNSNGAGVKFIKTVGTIILIVGLIVTVILLIMAVNLFSNTEAVYSAGTLFIYAIISFVISLFLNALCLNIANINENLTVLCSIKKQELIAIGISLIKED